MNKYNKMIIRLLSNYYKQMVKFKHNLKETNVYRSMHITAYQHLSLFNNSNSSYTFDKQYYNYLYFFILGTTGIDIAFQN